MMYSAYKLNKQVTIYSLDILLSQLWTSPLFHAQFCCFLTCIQVYQEAGKLVWHSYLLKNFPQFVVIHTVKSFSIVNEAEVDIFFLELSCFFYDSVGVGNLISGSSAFSKSSLYFWKFSVHVLLNIGEENGNPLQYSFLENSMDRGTWGLVHVVAKSWPWLSTSAHCWTSP